MSLVSLLILASSSHWWQLLVAMVLCGAANASAQIASNLAVAGSVAAEHQGLAFGAKQAAVPAATLVAGFFGADRGSSRRLAR